MSDEVPVLVGTLAFGSASIRRQCAPSFTWRCPSRSSSIIRKPDAPDATASLPTARSCGRGATWVLLAHFVDRLTDPAEKERAWQRYHAMRRFAESGQCRHRQICLHFGETPKWNPAACAMFAAPSRSGSLRR